MSISLYSLPTDAEPEPKLLDATAGFLPTGRKAYLRADNDTLVDAADGTLLAGREIGETDESWAARCEAFPQNTRLQLNHFEWLRDHDVVAFGAMLRYHIEAGKALGRLDG